MIVHYIRLHLFLIVAITFSYQNNAKARTKTATTTTSCLVDSTTPPSLHFTSQPSQHHQQIADQSGRKFLRLHCSGRATSNDGNVQQNATVRWWMRTMTSPRRNTSSSAYMKGLYDTISDDTPIVDRPGLRPSPEELLVADDHDSDVTIDFHCTISHGGQSLRSDAFRRHAPSAHRREQGPEIATLPRPQPDASPLGTFFRCALDHDDDVTETTWRWLKRRDNATTVVTSDDRHLGAGTGFLQIVRPDAADDAGEYACDVSNRYGRQTSPFVALRVGQASAAEPEPDWLVEPPPTLFVPDDGDVIIDSFVNFDADHVTKYGLVRVSYDWNAMSRLLCWSGGDEAHSNGNGCQVEGGRFVLRSVAATQESEPEKPRFYKLAVVATYKDDADFDKFDLEDRFDWSLFHDKQRPSTVAKVREIEVVTYAKPNLTISGQHPVTTTTTEGVEVIEFEQFGAGNDNAPFRLTCESDQTDVTSSQVTWYRGDRRVDVVPYGGGRHGNGDDDDNNGTWTSEYQELVTSQRSELVIGNISEEQQGYWQCRQLGIQQQSIRTVRLVMATTKVVPPVTGVRATLRNGNNIAVEWHRKLTPDAGYRFRYLVFARSLATFGPDKFVARSTTGSCPESETGSCRAYLTDMQPFARNYVTIRTDMVMTSPSPGTRVYHSVESEAEVIDTTGCAPEDLASDVGLKKPWYRLNPTSLLVAWKFHPDYKRCGDVTNYHFITGYGYHLEEQHFEVPAANYQLPVNLSSVAHLLPAGDDSVRFVLFQNLRQDEQFWYAVRPETKYGFRKYKAHFHPRNRKRTGYAPDKQIRYDVKPFRQQQPSPQCLDKVRSNGVKKGVTCAFVTINCDGQLELRMRCEWDRAMLDGDPILDFRVSNFLYDSDDHQTVHTNVGYIEIPVSDVWDAYIITVRVTYPEVESCFLFSDVFFIGRYATPSGDRVAWEDAYVSLTSLNVTWTYEARREDAERKLRRYEVRYFRNLNQVDEREDFVVVQRNENWLKLGSLQAGVEYKFQIRPVFDDDLPAKDFIFPTHSVFTVCPNTTTGVDANVKVTYVGEKTFRVEWEEGSVEYPESVIRDYTFHFSAFHANGDSLKIRRPVEKLFNITEAQVYTDDVTRTKRIYVRCLRRGEWKLTIGVRFHDCQLFRFSSRVFHLLIDHYEGWRFCDQTPELGVPVSTTTTSTKATAATPTPIQKTAATTTTTPSIAASDTTVATTTTTILSAVMSLAVIVVIFVLIWKYGIGQARSRNLIHKSIFCFDCRKSSSASSLDRNRENPPNRNHITSFITSKDKSALSVDGTSYREVLAPPSEQPLINLADLSTHIQIKNEKLRHHENRIRNMTSARPPPTSSSGRKPAGAAAASTMMTSHSSSSSSRGVAAKLRRCLRLTASRGDASADDVAATPVVVVAASGRVHRSAERGGRTPALNEQKHQHRHQCSNGGNTPRLVAAAPNVFFSHPIPRHSFQRDVTPGHSTTTTSCGFPGNHGSGKESEAEDDDGRPEERAVLLGNSSSSDGNKK